MDGEREEAFANGANFFSSGAAAKVLIEARVPTVELHTVDYSYETKLFGRLPTTATAKTYGKGWLLGTYRWTYHDGGNYGGSDVNGEFPTVLRAPGTPDSVVYAESRLVCVTPDAEKGGYIVRTSRHRLASGHYAFPTIAARVRELAGQR